MLCIRPVGCMQILYINRRMEFSGSSSLPLSPSLCTALLAYFACMLLVHNCNMPQTQTTVQEGEGTVAGKGTCLRQTSQIKAAGHTIQKKPKSTGSFGVGNKLKRVPQVPLHVSFSLSVSLSPTTSD